MLVGFVPVGLAFLIYIGVNIIPFLLIAMLGAVLLLATRFRGNLATASGQRKARPAAIQPLSFDQIGGQERAKEELIEALDFIIKHAEIAKLGIRPLRGILLSGPPGTGKTLLAKAAAEHTDSVFFAASGSEFVEMYVGVGASRIRELFKEARQKAAKTGKNSAILFIDEIEVIGGKRDGGQQREYDQTLNQLLTEMDGIHSSDTPRMLVIAATNRKEMLDSALLRPGRFDRHIDVALPDKKGRSHILHIHAKNKPLHDDVDLERIAEESYGFSGAQLESVMNEAAIYALRAGESTVQQSHLSLAIDKVLIGEKTDRETSKEERERVAVHELGHAIMAEVVHPGSVSQVALSPRGQALGYVRHQPRQEQYMYTKEFLEGQILIALAGAAAEEIFYGSRSTGAKGDFEQALGIVRTMIDCGLTELGIVDASLVSPDAWARVSGSMLDGLMEQARSLLQGKREVFAQSLGVLLGSETLSGVEFRQLLATNSGQEAAV